MSLKLTSTRPRPVRLSSLTLTQHALDGHGGAPEVGQGWTQLMAGLNTERLGWVQVVVRALIWSLPFTIGYAMLWLFALLNGLLPLWNVKRQAIHDLRRSTNLFPGMAI